MDSLKRIFGNRYVRVSLLLAFFCLVLISRRPDAVTNAQFLSEDEVWYSDAYHASSPIAPFLHPMQGYFQSIGRIGAFASLFFNLRNAPLVLNLIAIVIELLPALFFLSRRFEKIVPKFRYRFLISLLYVLLPATFETHANITNSQWRLVILTLLIIIAAPSKKTWEKMFDGLFLFIGGVSGPFVLFLFPILLVHRYFSEHKKRCLQIAVLGSAFVLQVGSMIATALGFFTKDVRVSAPLGASLDVFFKLVAGKIFVAGTFGLSRYSEIKSLDLWKSGLLPVVIGIVGLSLLAYTAWNATLEVRLLLLLITLVFAAALISPQTSTNARWVNMLKVRTGNRYFFLPILGWNISLVWLTFKSQNKVVKYSATALLACVVLLGIPHDWKFDKFKDWHFQKQVTEFEKLPAGSEYVFKTAPDWKMTLIKK